MNLHNNATNIKELEKSLFSLGKPFAESDIVVNIANFTLETIYNVAIFCTKVKPYESLGDLHSAIIISDTKEEAYDIDDSIFDNLEPVSEQINLAQLCLSGTEIVELIRNESLGFNNFLLTTGLLESASDMDIWGDQNCHSKNSITIGGEMTHGYIELEMCMISHDYKLTLPSGTVFTGSNSIPKSDQESILSFMTTEEFDSLETVLKAALLF